MKNNIHFKENKVKMPNDGNEETVNANSAETGEISDVKSDTDALNAANAKKSGSKEKTADAKSGEAEDTKFIITDEDSLVSKPVEPKKTATDVESGETPKAAPGKKRKLPAALFIVIDVLLAALILLVFYITNYVIEYDVEPMSAPSHYTAEESDPAADPSPTVSAGETTVPSVSSPASASPAASPSSALKGWRAKFPDKFTTGNVEKTDTSYKSSNVNVTVKQVKDNDITYYVADIYVADIKYFKTAFPKGKKRMGSYAFTDDIAKQVNAIIAVNGDHCVNNPGPVVRNGDPYRLEKAGDALIMHYDGTMETVSADQLDLKKIKSEGAWQVWTFGPMLLSNGKPITDASKFDLPNDIKGPNPRTGIGYYEPGHYCYVVVDGRQAGYSDGIDMVSFSKLFYDLGCKVAFNLDGGKSTEMVFMNKIVDKPYQGSRETPDILYVGE